MTTAPTTTLIETMRAGLTVRHPSAIAVHGIVVLAARPEWQGGGYRIEAGGYHSVHGALATAADEYGTLVAADLIGELNQRCRALQAARRRRTRIAQLSRRR